MKFEYFLWAVCFLALAVLFYSFFQILSSV